MSKEITTEGWVSVIPDKIYNSWVKKKWIQKGYVHLSQGDNTRMGGYLIMEKMKDNTKPYGPSERKLSNSPSETRRLKALGFEPYRKHYYVSSKHYKAMRKEVYNWYNNVFDYVNKWLISEGLAVLEKGTFNGGFCAETNPDHDVVKNWGAPLAKPENKVVQVKEKFGRIVVYFCGLTKQEQTKINKFAIHCEKKFDCCADFV